MLKKIIYAVIGLVVIAVPAGLYFTGNLPYFSPVEGEEGAGGEHAVAAMAWKEDTISLASRSACCSAARSSTR